MTHPDLPAEQAHVDLAYDAAGGHARPPRPDMLQDAFGERGGTFQAVTERDIRVRTSLNRLEQLEIGRESLVFGRIDRRTADRPPTARRGHRGVPHRPAGHLRRGPGAAGRRLAGARSPSRSTGRPAPIPWASPAGATS